MSDLSLFFSELDAMKDNIYKKIEKIIKDVVVEIHISLLSPTSAGGTPKITGWLRGSWIISTDTFSSSTIGSKDNVAAAVTAQGTAFNAFKRQDLLGTSMIYLTNPVPYAMEVEQGGPRNIQRNMKKNAVKNGEYALQFYGNIK